MVYKFFDHPIRYTGLSMNRIMFSNTRMVMAGFPGAKEQQFNLSFKYKTYKDGKEEGKKCKQIVLFSKILTRYLVSFVPQTFTLS